MSTAIDDTEVVGFTLDFGEREIYNDIRTECDVTEILEVRPDATPDLFETFTAQGDYWGIPPGSSMDITAYAADEHTEIVWLQVVDFYSNPVTQFDLTQEECEGLGGTWRAPDWPVGVEPFCILPSSLGPASYRIISRGTNSCTVRVTNESSDFAISVLFRVSYQALTPEKRYIAKYGRRTMDLRWYVGQTPNQMQTIIDGKCDKYSEPYPVVNVTMRGKTDALVTKILGLKIDDKVALTHTRLNINDDFWVSNVSGSHDVNGLLEGIFDLENVKPEEEYTYFELDVSKLDEAYLAP
jgi:hypothetical protein